MNLDGQQTFHNGCWLVGLLLLIPVAVTLLTLICSAGFLCLKTATIGGSKMSRASGHGPLAPAREEVER